MIKLRNKYSLVFGKTMLTDLTLKYIDTIDNLTHSLDDLQKAKLLLSHLPQILDYETIEVTEFERKEILTMVIGEANDQEERKRKEAFARPGYLEELMMFHQIKKIFIFKDLRYKFSKNTKLTGYERSISNQWSGYNNNFISYFWKIGKWYDFSNTTKYEIETTINSPNYKRSYLIEDSKHMIIGIPGKQGYKIVYMCDYCSLDFYRNGKYVQVKNLVKVIFI